MANETTGVAEYAVALRYDDIPADVIERAKHCIVDTVASIVFGYQLPWSQIVVAYAERNGAGGSSRILGSAGAPVHAPAAALANGALAHAFEMDNLTWPSTGVHPGATLLSAGLAVAQERGIGGRELLTAFVAGAEVMIRIGRATKHSNEIRGFHAPGTTGPFGAAIACGRVMGFDAQRMRNALGIAGSLACGLLEFARSGTGAMVKSPTRASSHAASAPTMRPAPSCSSVFRATSPRTPRCKPSRSFATSTGLLAAMWPRSRLPATTAWRRSTASPRPPTS
jgi:2-methylcitrate dehydratase PrpD